MHESLAGGMHYTQSIATRTGGQQGKREGVTLDLVLYIDQRQIHCDARHNPLGSHGSPMSLCWGAIFIHNPQLPCKLRSGDSA